MALTKSEIVCYLLLGILCLVLKVMFQAQDWVLVIVAVSGGLVAWAYDERKKTIQIEKEEENRPKYVSKYSVSFDEEGISSKHADGVVEELRWSEISDVYIEIVDSFLPEPWWILFNKERCRCSFPLSAVGQKDAVAEFEKRLVGFRNKATYKEVATAMVAMAGAYKVWPRHDEENV
jgi:hypothetical protein